MLRPQMPHMTMSLIPYVVLVTVMLIGLNVQRWFWRFKYIEYFGPDHRAIIAKLDDYVVSGIDSDATIRAIRGHDGGRTGGRTVIVHHLADLAEDIEDQVRNALGISVMYTMLLLVSTLVFEEIRSENASGVIGQVGALEGIKTVLSNLPSLYLNIIPIVGGLAWQFASIKTLQKAIYKYKGILRAVNPSVG